MVSGGLKASIGCTKTSATSRQQKKNRLEVLERRVTGSNDLTALQSSGCVLNQERQVMVSALKACSIT